MNFEFHGAESKNERWCTSPLNDLSHDIQTYSQPQVVDSVLQPVDFSETDLDS